MHYLKAEQMTIKRALTLQDLRDYRPKVANFTGDWLDLVGCPELKGSWIIWGDSGNGKTSFAVSLAKYLSNFGKVAYNTLEQGLSKSFNDAMNYTENSANERKFSILNREDFDFLKLRLSRKQAPQIVIIDSLQYLGCNYSELKKLFKQYPNKLFIFISHANGRQPFGSTAMRLKYNSEVKIEVRGFKAFALSRYGGGKPYTIWEEGAQKFYGYECKE